MLTAHHQDDQVETVLMNVLHGSGLTGLRGMRVVAPLPNSSGTIHILRPLLTTARGQIEAYCAKHHLRFVEDASNTDERYLRNRLRQRIVPELKAINPAVGERVASLSQLVADEEAWLTQLTTGAFQAVAQLTEQAVLLNRAEYKAQPLALRRRLLRRAAEHVGIDRRSLSFRLLEQARLLADTATVPRQADASGGWFFTATHNEILLARELADSAEFFPQTSIEKPHPLTPPCQVSLDKGWVLTLTQPDTIPSSMVEHNQDRFVAYCQLAAGTDLFLRTPLAGEKMRPLGLGGSKSVRDVLADKKVMGEFRPKWPMIATADHPVWIVGHLLDERARVQRYDAPILKISVFQRA